MRPLRKVSNLTGRGYDQATELVTLVIAAAAACRVPSPPGSESIRFCLNQAPGSFNHAISSTMNAPSIKDSSLMVSSMNGLSTLRSPIIAVKRIKHQLFGLLEHFLVVTENKYCPN